MRNFVQRIFVGTGVAWKELDTLAKKEIVAFDWETKKAPTADSTAIGLKIGLPMDFTVGPISTKLESKNYKTLYNPGTASTATIKILVAPSDNESAMFKLATHASLQLAPNRMSQKLVALKGLDGETPEEFAIRLSDAMAIAAEDYIISVSGATVSIKFKEDYVPYNNINRPERIYFEIGVPEAGSYEVVETNGITPIGNAEQIMWLEDLYQGRYGFSDRTNWNAKKYPHQAEIGKTYDMVSIDGNIAVEGDMQDVRYNPVGVMLALESDAGLEGDLNTAGFIFKDISAV